MTPTRGVPIVAAPSAAVAIDDQEEPLDPELEAVLNAAHERTLRGERGIPAAEAIAWLREQAAERRRGH